MLAPLTIALTVLCVVVFVLVVAGLMVVYHLRRMAARTQVQPELSFASFPTTSEEVDGRNEETPFSGPPSQYEPSGRRLLSEHSPESKLCIPVEPVYDKVTDCAFLADVFKAVCMPLHFSEALLPRTRTSKPTTR